MPIIAKMPNTNYKNVGIGHFAVGIKAIKYAPIKTLGSWQVQVQAFLLPVLQFPV